MKNKLSFLLPEIFSHIADDVSFELFVHCFDNSFDVILLDHLVVVHDAVQDLNIMEFPRFPVLPVKRIIAKHCSESLLVLGSDGNLIVFVQHDAEIPVATCPRTIPCFFILDFERSTKLPQC